MEISARNELNGTIKDVKLGQVMAEITLRVDEEKVVAVITKASAEYLGLKAGGKAFALIKATEVMVGK